MKSFTFFTIFALTSLSVGMYSIPSFASDAKTKKKAEAEQEEKIEFQTEVDPKIYSPKDFQKKSGHKTRALPENGRPLMPSKEERDSVFTKVDGLNSEISNLDELAKDLLYTRAKTRSINELAKIYPNISPQHLTNLQKQIQESEKKK